MIHVCSVEVSAAVTAVAAASPWLRSAWARACACFRRVR